MWIKRLKCPVLFLFILATVPFSYGQSTFGTIVGVVRDPAGAVILSATDTLNHPNFALPNANISAPNNVGRITKTPAREEAAARTLMLGTRIEF